MVDQSVMFCNEEVVMAETKRMAEEANRMGQEAQEQLIGVRSLEQAIQIQSDYAKRVYENHMAELSKLGEMCVGMVRDVSKPVEETSRKFR